MLSKINRRSWLKTSVLSTGALAVGAALPAEATSRAARGTASEGKLLELSPFLGEYQPPKFPDPDTLKARLCWNENPYGPSPKAIEAFQKATFKGNHYSWNHLYELIDKISDKEGVKPENIMMGPGSSDLLEKTAMVLYMTGGNIVSGDPSYMSLVNVSKSIGADWKAVRLTDNYQHDLLKMEAAIDTNTKLVYITNPNNPTGTITDRKALYDFCSRVSEKVPVFIDEAYMELAEGGLKSSMAPLVAKGKNVIVSRTFSKIHGMAGLRIGYIVAKEEILEKIKAITRGGMGITGPSIHAASASLDDVEFQDKCKAMIREARSYTFELLESKGYDYMPAETNFIIFPIPMEGDKFLEKIYEKKVAVRVFQFWDKTWCRVSMGTMKEMKIFARAFEAIVG